MTGHSVKHIDSGARNPVTIESKKVEDSIDIQRDRKVKTELKVHGNQHWWKLYKYKLTTVN